MIRLNPMLPPSVVEMAIEKVTRTDLSRSLAQHNRDFHTFIRDGVPVEWRTEGGYVRHERVRVLDFGNPDNNRYLAVRELKIQGERVPHYNRRADLVCFVNGLPLVFIELKAVYVNIRAGFDNGRHVRRPQLKLAAAIGCKRTDLLSRSFTTRETRAARLKERS